MADFGVQVEKSKVESSKVKKSAGFILNVDPHFSNK